MLGHPQKFRNGPAEIHKGRYFWNGNENLGWRCSVQRPNMFQGAMTQHFVRDSFQLAAESFESQTGLTNKAEIDATRH